MGACEDNLIRSPASPLVRFRIPGFYAGSSVDFHVPDRRARLVPGFDERFPAEGEAPVLIQRPKTGLDRR